MEGICIDANIFVSALDSHEAFHPQAVLLLTNIQNKRIPLFEPEVILFEVGCAFHRKAAMGQIKDSEADRLMNLLFRYPFILQWEAEITQRAFRLSKSLQERGIADGYYLALAEKRKIPFVTMDEKLLRRAKDLYDKVYSASEAIELTSQ